MTKTVKTTKIEKKYKDKKTGEFKSITIEHAKVKDRINEFRQDNPNGKIETIPTMLPDGQVMFKAYILKDKSDETSADATGHAIGRNESEKDFEKLETIAVGRALALLGYAASGEIASSEEMEEFLKYQEEKKQETILEMTAKICDAKTIDELKEVWAKIDGQYRKDLETLKEDRKKILTNEKTNLPK
jgi:hypothetical protein